MWSDKSVITEQVLPSQQQKFEDNLNVFQTLMLLFIDLLVPSNSLSSDNMPRFDWQEC